MIIIFKMLQTNIVTLFEFLDPHEDTYLDHRSKFLVQGIKHRLDSRCKPSNTLRHDADTISALAAIRDTIKLGLTT